MPNQSFPRTRLRRNRHAPWLRNLVRETELSLNDLIWPLFIIEGTNIEQDIPSMPGVKRYSIDRAVSEVIEAYKLGIQAFALFPCTDAELKDSIGSEALNSQNLMCRSIRAIKEAVPEAGLICDVALDPYTDHGHDGLIINGQIDNDQTLDILGQQALIQADAGADIIAPSDMMDGRIGFIRDLLDKHNFQQVGICAYAAKYASSFYGPFRDAVQSGGFLKGDKKTYQMDFANIKEARQEVALDISEGADMVMVKPALAYLDIIKDVSQTFETPVFAYQVSGEYSMLVGAIQNGWLSENVIEESLIAIKRAGATAILSYFAKHIALKRQH